MPTDLDIYARPQGTIEGNAHMYKLDNGHDFETGRRMAVCGNTAAMLGEGGTSWLSKHFEVRCSLRFSAGSSPSVRRVLLLRSCAAVRHHMPANPVCPRHPLANMISRFADQCRPACPLQLVGDRSVHYGAFLSCQPDLQLPDAEAPALGGSCC